MEKSNVDVNSLIFFSTFQGIVAHSEDLLDDSNLTKLILNNNLVLFCWGEDNNDRNNITKLKQQGVHGVIFDKYNNFVTYNFLT